MVETAKFWDKMAAKYAAAPIRDQESYEYTLGRTRSYLNKTDHVLEIGCGTGSTALLLAEDVAEIVATDISPKMTRIALEKAESQQVDNIRFKVCSAYASAQEAAGVDVVMGFNILHLTDDLEGLLDMLHREMSPDSLLITKTPCLSEPSIGFKRFLFRAIIPVLQLFGKAPPVRSLSFKELEETIAGAGFKIVETGSYPAMSRFVVARRT